MRRREFVAGLGIAAVWPRCSCAEPAAKPVIGLLSSDSLDLWERRLRAFRQGLSETGYVEGRNVDFEYRLAENHLKQLPDFATDLVRHQVNVIVATPTPAAVAAKAATKSIPIVFVVGVDPVKTGLVPSLARPGGNVTGLSNVNEEVAAKRLEMLHELLPAATLIAYLANPTNTAFTNPETAQLQAAARNLGVRLLILNASDPSEFEAAFASVVRERAGGLVIGGDALFIGSSPQLVPLAARYEVPSVYPTSVAVTVGGLMSYGADAVGAGHQAGIYTGRILKGERPADLPVQQSTKIEVAVNLKTTKALGLTVPQSILLRADEVMNEGARHW
jgi:putative tryptophan/tyrosine transport system substrate-binding protein